MSDDLDRLQAAIGYTFSDISLLRQALVHSSATSQRLKSNERMEFLGDRVLGLVIADMLLAAYPEEEEGEIGYRFTALAQRDALARVAEKVSIANYLQLSNGEIMTGGRENPGLLADAVEALIAALYRDGGLNVARSFIEAHWKEMMQEYSRPPKDAKTSLQEWAQARSLPLPSYQVVDQSGPDHQPIFTVEVNLPRQEPARGEGTNKRQAEQAAAAELLNLVGGSK